MLKIEETDALLVVDVQNDFCTGGALPVPFGERVVSPINSMLKFFDHIVFTRDWHPEDHCSFSFEPEFRDGSWPVHCIEDTPGAEFHPDLRVPVDALIINKATDSGREAYSGFDRTGLAELLRERGVERVFVAGLTLDYCVRTTVLDALREGFSTVLVEDGIRAVLPENTASILEELRAAGGGTVRSNDIQ